MMVKMNKNKTIMILVISLILLTIGLSAVSAANTVENTTADNNLGDTSTIADDNSKVYTPVITNENNKNIKESNEKTIKNDEGYDSFTNLQTELIDKEEVILETDYLKNEDESLISINNSITIDGNGHTIESNNGTFNIRERASVTLKNMILTGNNGTNALISTNGNLTCINVTFTDNSRITSDCMVEIISYANLTLINCTTKNQCSTSAFDVNSYSNVYVENSTFDNIYSLTSSIRFRNRYINATITNSNFTNNRGANYGGALYSNNANQNITIDNCYFENNSAGTRGGAIRSSGNLTLKNSIFLNNNLVTETETGQQYKKGGALWLASGNVELSNNTMNDCENLSAEIYNDGATILSPINMIISNITTQEDTEFNVTVNMTDDNGNTIDLYSLTLKIYDNEDNEILSSQLEHKNENIHDGIATFNLVAEMEMGNYTMTIANDEEEILYPNISDATLEVTKSPYLKYKEIQQMIDDAQENDTITLEADIKRGTSEEYVNLNKSLTLDVNNRIWDAKDERIFEVTNQATVTVKNMEAINIGNQVPVYGNTEGRFANITSGNLTLENVHITNSTAPIFGGNTVGTFIDVSNTSSLYIYNSTIEDSQATVILSNGIVEINNTIIRNIYTPGTDYPSLIDNRGRLDINNTQIINNTVNLAIVYGKDQSQPMTVDNTIFINNVAGKGSGVALRTKDKTNVTNSIFINNTAGAMSSKGGAIYSGADLLVYNSTFIGNYAYNNDGSIIYVDNGDLNISNSILVPVNASKMKAIYNAAESQTTAVANYNWWGTNSTPASYVASGTYTDYDSWYEEEYDCTPIEVKYWIVMNTTVQPEDNINYKDTVEITTSFNKYTDGSEYYELDVPLQDTITLTYSSNRGNFSQESINTTGGIAKVYYTVTSPQSTVTIATPDETNTLNITATTPTPQKIILNDGNYTYYFNEDGTVKEDIIYPYYELQFEGEFNNRNIIITMPLNITTAPTQAVLNNCTITVEQKAGDTIIKDIQMKNYNYSSYLIYVDATTNLTIQNNTLHNENNEIEETHAIIVEDADDIKIIENNITTIGLSKNVNYNENTKVYTTSINVITTDNLIIDSNNITTNYTGTSEIYGTIESIDIRGQNNKLQQSTVISNNQINTEAEKYAYGIVLNGLVANTTINGNIINTISNSYANGIELFNSSYNNITNNMINVESDEFTYAIFISSAYDYETYKLTSSDHNIISNNILESQSKVSYVIELYQTQYNNINHNTIISNASSAIGIAGYASGYNDLSYNNIDLLSNMDESQITNYDSIDSYPNGIKLVYSSSPYSGRNNITYNNITLKSTSEKETYAVNVTESALNNIKYNYLVASTVGNESVIATGYGSIVENNTPIKDLTDIILTTENITIMEGQTAQLAVNIKNTNDETITEGNVTFTVEGLEEIISVDNGQAILEYTNTAGIYTVNIVYVNGTHWSNITTATITIKSLKNVNIEVNDTTAYINQPATINAIFTDDEGQLIQTGTVELRDLQDNLIDSTNLTNGQITFNLTFSKVNTTTMNIIYLENDEYKQAEQTITLTIKKPSTIITFEEFTLTPGQKTNITAIITDELGQPVTNGKVVFKINGKTLKDDNNKIIYVKVVNGTAILEYTLPENWANKNLTIQAVYSGSAKYESSRSQQEQINITKISPTLKIETDNEIKVGETRNITVKVLNTPTTLNTGKIVLKINGKTLKDENNKVIYLTVKDGQVTFEVSFASYKPKTYTISAIFIDNQYERIEDNVNVTLTR